MPNLIDSHAHLNLLKDPVAALLEASHSGVSHIITVGIDLPSSRLAVEVASTNDQVFAAVGIHPNNAAHISETDMNELAALTRDSARVMAIGETGLDFYRDHCPKDVQEAAFLMHMDLARDTGLPLIVHSRDASKEILALLERHGAGLQVILHCFSLHDHVDICAERGYFMSIAGNVTFPKATALRTAVSQIPPDLLLTETDSPYLSPVPRRGKENSPANIRYTLDEIAALRGVAGSYLADQVYSNFISIFGLNSTV